MELTGRAPSGARSLMRPEVPWGTGTLVLPFIGECENDLGVMG